MWLNAPPQALEVVSKVLQESDIWLSTVGLNDKTQKEAIMSGGGVWWKKIAEKRKERCKLHSMARAENVKKQSFSHVYL